MSTPDPLRLPTQRIIPTAQDKGAFNPGRIRVHHDSLIDLQIANPGITRTQLADISGYTPEYISMLTCSDAWQARLAARRETLVDPLIKEEVEARMRAVASLSLQRLQEKLAKPVDQIPDNLVLKAVELGARGMSIGGFSAKAQEPPPPKSSAAHIEELAGRLSALIPDRKAGAIDVESREVPPL